MEKEFTQFLTTHVEKVKPLMKQMNLSYWDASISGRPEDYQRNAQFELELRTIYSDSNDFKLLKKFKNSDLLKNPLLNRQLNLLYNSYLSNQIAPDLLRKMVEQSKAVENKFNVFRGTVDGVRLTDNEIKEILRKETDPAKRRAVWFASKQVGREVAADLIGLIKVRNEAAQKLGFKNYYIMSLSLVEQDVNELNRIFDELAELTAEPFLGLKSELDSILAVMYGTKAKDIMPWHYHDPFFQEGPLVYQVDLNEYFADQDVRKVAQNFFNNIGLNVDNILERSDLYEKEGKYPHAYCTDIDREGDVRILTNIKNDEKWMDTMLHELGHAVYDSYLDMSLPFLLREPAHIFTTEATAMFFGRLSRNAYWIQQMVGITDAERDQIDADVSKSLRLQQLIFARWCQVMFRFEQALYDNPDQDLNTLWWDLIEKYQMIRRPQLRNEPDWAAKIHFTVAPCYYHNYMLGELLASQFHSHLVKNVLGLASDEGVSYVNQMPVGKYFIEKVFRVGSQYPWNDMIRRATGEPLSPDHFVRQFVN